MILTNVKYWDITNKLWCFTPCCLLKLYFCLSWQNGIFENLWNLCNPIQLPAHHDNPGHLCEGGSYSSEMGLHRGGSKTITGAQKLNGSYYGWKIP